MAQAHIRTAPPIFKCKSNSWQSYFDMKTEGELRDLREKIKTQYGSNPILRLSKDTTLKVERGNIMNELPQNLSEIEYWRAMTNNFTSQLTCSCCGKLIYEERVPPIMKRILRLSECNFEWCIARCGKVIVPSPRNQKYKGGTYLVPLCGECYSKSEESFLLKEGSLLCKSLATHG